MAASFITEICVRDIHSPTLLFITNEKYNWLLILTKAMLCKVKVESAGREFRNNNFR